MTANNQPGEGYDVAILGGGLAGLSLGLQLKLARPQTSVFIAESRPGDAPEAAFKVGESTVEVSSYYFRDVLGLRDHLEHDEITKFGLRWWFPADGNRDIAQRIERGINRPLDHPSFQLDRGRFENSRRECARRGTCGSGGSRPGGNRESPSSARHQPALAIKLQLDRGRFENFLGSCSAALALPSPAWTSAPIRTR